VISSEHRSELEQPAIRHRSRDTCRLHIATTADPTLVTSQSRKEGHWRGWISASLVSFCVLHGALAPMVVVEPAL
jgi:hypothetical protein